MWFIIIYGVYFIIDRVKGKIVSYFMYKTTLAICYRPEWHYEQRRTISQLAEWIFL